jgi:thiamine biosynthesis protein ThiS
MRLWINGEAREAPPLGTVGDLAAWLGLPPFGSAVELNGTVIPRREQAATPLKEGDRLEVVRLVGGG